MIKNNSYYELVEVTEDENDENRLQFLLLKEIWRFLQDLDKSDLPNGLTTNVTNTKQIWYLSSMHTRTTHTSCVRKMTMKNTHDKSDGSSTIHAVD